MTAVLRGGVEVDTGEPVPRQLLDGGDVDAAVVKVGVDARHVLGEKRAIRANRVAREGSRLGGRHVLEDVLVDRELGVSERDTLRDLLEQSAASVHLRDKVVHVLERGLVGLDNHAEPGMHGHEVVVGNDHRNLDQLVYLEVKTCHFTVDPDEKVSIRGHASKSTGGH